MNKKPFKEKLIDVITDEKRRTKLQYTSVYVFLATVSAAMTIMNIITEKGTITVATSIFTALCLINLFVMLKTGEKGAKIAAELFMIEIILLFSFFIISGNPDGFSCLWVAMLPSCGMLLFGRKRAAILSAVMLALLAFFFWSPLGRSLLQYEYTATFMARFPILFVASFLLSFILETIRVITQQELDRLRETYQRLSVHDYLTQLLNRQGLEELRETSKATDDQALFMIDIDHFKATNDRYGHEAGDRVLASVAREIARIADTEVCRWGGEEFVVWFPDSGEMCDPDSIRKGVEALDIQLPGGSETIHVTVSIGAAQGTNDFDALIQSADACLYQAKKNGRNQVVCSMQMAIALPE